MREWLPFTSGPLPEETRLVLLGMVWQAQAASAAANHGNATNETVRNVAGASLDVVHALAAGMLATGGLHAPVTQAREVLFHSTPRPPTDGCKVPGFGNSFYRDRIDPQWEPLADRLATDFPTLWQQLETWRLVLSVTGRRLRVNPAGLSAAVAELVGWTPGLESLLVVIPRLPVWVRLHEQQTAGHRLMRIQQA